MMIILLTHICVRRPNELNLCRILLSKHHILYNIYISYILCGYYNAGPTLMLTVGPYIWSLCNYPMNTVRILIKISLKFVPKSPIKNIPALDQIMTWRRPGYKPLSEPMMIILLAHICVRWPQWVKSLSHIAFEISHLYNVYVLYILRGYYHAGPTLMLTVGPYIWSLCNYPMDTVRFMERAMARRLNKSLLCQDPNRH